MGIRTKGFQKVSQKSGEVEKRKSAPPQVVAIPDTTVAVAEEKVENSEGKKQQEKEAIAKVPATSSRPNTRVTSNINRSPLKLRTPATMARLGGIKVAARKLKKHRKRSLFVQSANKILRSSIKSNKTRRACRLEEKPRATVSTLPSRISTRTCVRRSSREGIPEAPLRTVELIKRPLELREPATKLLYMASLGLYPRTGDSDSTPIVVIREVNGSPGKKNGNRKSLELPLIPVSYHKCFMDLANQDKKSISENIKPAGKQSKPETARKSPPPKEAETDGKKVASDKKTPASTVSSQNVTPVLKAAQGLSGNETVKANLQPPQQQQAKKKTPPPKASYDVVNIPVPSPKSTTTLDLTTVVSKMLSSPILQEAGKVSPNSKSLLKSNVSPVSKATKEIPYLALPLNLTGSIPSRVETAKPTTTESLLASTCSVTQAMNLIMSNITILPSASTTNRKRSAIDGSDYKIEEISNSKNFSYLNANAPSEGKPPKKRQKNNNGSKASRPSLQASPIISPVTSNNSLSSLFMSPPPQSQNNEEALNLCMKRNIEPVFPIVNLPPKLQMNTNIVNSQKATNINGSKPLNLIIPRPPPLTKAPLEIANFANCTQNMQPIMPVKAKVQPKKQRKPRQNNNKVNHSNQQIQDAMPVLPPLPLLTNTDTTVHAKSLLKCMNGEENTCAREIGESLDSVKTMLSRLQTRIGPAVNGVRLITIE